MIKQRILCYLIVYSWAFSDMKNCKRQSIFACCTQSQIQCGIVCLFGAVLEIGHGFINTQELASLQTTYLITVLCFPSAISLCQQFGQGWLFIYGSLMNLRIQLGKHALDSLI